jgi:hypothetical protein
MPGGWRIRGAAVVAAAAGAVLALPVAATAAAPGTWGAGHYRYADGTVCRDGDTTAPLASWPLAGGSTGYLTREVTSTGTIDSAAPPVPAAGPPAAPVEVAPGDGFAAEADIAAVAYLLSEGHRPAGETAAAVLTQTDPGGLPACADRAAALAALADARRRAGPYDVRVVAGPGRARPGHPVPVAAIVRTAAGTPVAGAPVTFTAGSADVQPATAVTDRTGRAHATVAVSSAAEPTVTVTAATEVATGLQQATVTATRSATNPTGDSVPAVYAAPPSRFEGSAELSVDQSAHPQVSTALASRLVRTAKPFTPQADITGLNGHTATVSFTLLGPRPLADRTLCGDTWSARNSPAVATTSVTVTGDGRARGGSLTATTAGCYALQVRVATVDATPPAARSAPPVVLAALDTAVAGADDRPAVFAAHGAKPRLTGTVQVTHDHRVSTDVQLTVTGPVNPKDGDCRGHAAAWRRAPTETVAADTRSTPGSADGSTLRYSAPAPDEVGCYRVRPAVVLRADGNRLRVPADQQRPAYVLDPTVTAAVRQTWSVTPDPVPVQVDVAGLYGLPAHVRTVMYRTAPDPAGCTRATFRGTTQAATGPAATVPTRPGIVTVTLRSGPTPRVGCYAVVPELTVDAAPQVRVTGPLGSDQARLIAGVDPDEHLRPAAAHRTTGTGVAFLVAITALATVLLAVTARIGLIAYRSRGESAGESQNLLDLGDGELPSGS